MSYLASEYSVQDGDPIFKMLFVQGADSYRYTTFPGTIVDGDGTWAPVPFNPSEITQSQELAKDGLKIKMPRDNALAQTFVGGVPEVQTSITITRTHYSDVSEEYQVYWKGRVSGIDIDGDSLTLNCENIFTSMRRPGLSATFQRSCRHALYCNGCNLNDADFGVAATVTAAEGSTLLLSGLVTSSQDEVYFRGGTLETSGGHKRFIVQQDGDTLTLMRPMPALNEEVNSSAGSASVTLYPGCDHTVEACKEKFDNLDNFGGFPWIPTKNPFTNSVKGSIV